MDIKLKSWFEGSIYFAQLSHIYFLQILPQIYTLGA